MIKKIAVSILISCLLISIIILVHVCRAPREERKPMDDRLPAEKQAPAKYPLQPSRPEDYGMVVFQGYDPVLTEGEAQTLIHSKLRDIKKEFPRETLDRVRDQIKEDPEKTKEKIRQIDEEIAKCQELLKNDPSNEATKSKLQHLYLLKSIAYEMPQAD